MKSAMNLTFDISLACRAAALFSAVSGIGCVVVEEPAGQTLCEAGYACSRCALCAMNPAQEACAASHRFGLREAERFGGSYVYFCARGLTFIACPLMGRARCEARLSAGPFLMVEAEDYLALEMESGQLNQNAPALAREVPYVPPEKAQQWAELLKLLAQNASQDAASRQLRRREASDQLQGRVSEYIHELKQKEPAPPYPFEKEAALLQAMTASQRKQANKLLNELLGHILLLSGMAFDKMKSRINELLVLMSRKAIENGASPAYTQDRMQQYFAQLSRLEGFDELCLWLSEAMNELISLAFDYSDARHASAIHRSMQHIRAHLDEKIELGRLAQAAYLSPDYFSRIFKRETGRTIQAYIMEQRMKRACELMAQPELRLQEIAHLVGIADSSYFTRVFRKTYGLSPKQYQNGLLDPKSRNSTKKEP